ncbi:Mitochondrial outer membrane protein porin 5 [Platanthera guangdongensis]|uniref:Mitochondrial outer membrane protein porin 5 n=1 Tax=Platanthera guangdongensis TaxID=2320717 RepID=A0ABR2LCW7_9ASPA
MKGPGLFSDIGKKAKDILTRGYSSDQKLSISTSSASGVVLTSSAVKKGGLYTLDVSTQYNYKNALIDVKVDTDSNITTSVTYLEDAPNVRAAFLFKLPDYNSGTLEVQYFHDHAALASSVAMKRSPVVDFSATFGAHGIVFGAEAGFDTASGVLTKYNAGLGVKKPELDVSVIVADKGDTIRASYLHHFDKKQNSSAVAEITKRFSTNEKTFSVGGAYEMDPLTTVKARLNNSGKLGALLQHGVKPNLIMTLSGEFETKALDRTPKFGLSLALKPF